jgi:hypothetical protein
MGVFTKVKGGKRVMRDRTKTVAGLGGAGLLTWFLVDPTAGKKVGDKVGSLTGNVMDASTGGLLGALGLGGGFGTTTMVSMSSSGCVVLCLLLVAGIFFVGKGK